MDHIDALIAELRAADFDGREAIKAKLEEQCRGDQGSSVRSHIEKAARSEILEIQWELEEVVEATAPPKPVPQTQAPHPEPEPEPPADRPLSASDMEVVYDDPRGIVLSRTHDGSRWFLTQVHPQTGQPQTMELRPHELQQVKSQLAGSPYWVLGQES